MKLPPINLLVENKRLYDTGNTTNTLEGIRFLIDMSSVQKRIGQGL